MGQGGNAEPNSAGGNTDPSSGGQDDVTLTKQQLKGRLEAERARASRTAADAIYAKAGVVDGEELLSIIERSRENESETKRQQREYAQLQKSHDALFARVQEFERAEKRRAIDGAIVSAIEAEAGKGRKAIKPSQVVALLRADAGIDEAGNLQIGGDSARDAVKKFYDSNPHLLAPINPSGGAGSRTSGSALPASGKPGSSMSSDERRSAFVTAMKAAQGK